MCDIQRKQFELLVTFFIILCLSATLISPNLVFPQNTVQSQTQEYVSTESMQMYAETLIAEYDKNINQYFPTTKYNFSFFSDGSYSIKSFISSQYGAALWFEPSNVLSFENRYISEPVELALFGGNFSTWPLFFEPGHHVTINGGTYELNGHPLVQLSNVSSVIFRNIFVIQPNFQRNYTCVIMKGNNETSNWTLDIAKEDAIEILYTDMRVEFPVSEEVRQRYAEPELTALLQKIIGKLQNTSQPYSASEWKQDMQNIENIARMKYGLTEPTEFINGIIDFLNARTTGILPTLAPEPTATPIRTILGINDYDNWIYVTLFGCYPIFIYALFLFLKYINKKYDSEDWNFLTHDVLLQGIMISIGAGFFVLNYPYDSPLAIPQIIVVIVIAVFGIYILHKVKKKLFAWRLTRGNNPKSINNKTQYKTDKTPKTDKK
jgi:hypothetical protein